MSLVNVCAVDAHHSQLDGGCPWRSDVGWMASFTTEWWMPMVFGCRVDFIIHNCIADVMIYGRRGRCSQFTGVWWVPVSYG